MATLIEMKQDHKAAIQRSDAIIAAAENAGRALTENENADLDAAVAEAQGLSSRIAAAEKVHTLRGGAHLLGGSPDQQSVSSSKGKSKVLGADYQAAFKSWLLSGGTHVDAALYEGVGSAGGFAVPVTVDSQIVPLAPPETGIRRLATVLATTNDVKMPRQTAASTVTDKAESGVTINNFVETGPALDEVTLGAFMAGAVVKLSFELAQDVPAFQAFAVNDLLNAQQQFEETRFISGTGVGQQQGLLGNVGAGVTEAADASGNLLSIDGTLDLVGSLAAEYHEGAAFLMNRLTGIIIRKAQRQSNLYTPVWTNVNGVDYLHNYRVEYSAAMPTAAHGATPLLFGNFKAGFVIGDRGGSAINVKVLDQPFAVAGQIALLAYRRTDSRVRRPQAIQSYTVAAS